MKKLPDASIERHLGCQCFAGNFCRLPGQFPLGLLKQVLWVVQIKHLSMSGRAWSIVVCLSPFRCFTPSLRLCRQFPSCPRILRCQLWQVAAVIQKVSLHFFFNSMLYFCFGGLHKLVVYLCTGSARAKNAITFTRAWWHARPGVVLIYLYQTR